METLLQSVSQMTVGQKVVTTLLIFAVTMGVIFALTVMALSLRIAAILWLGVFAALAAAALIFPVGTGALTADPSPEVDYAGALARLEAESARDATPLNPLCPSRLFGHGRRTETVVVLLHGISSCPQAFVDFAPLAFERGHNVLVLRMPYNGFADRATDALRRLTAEDLRAYGDTAVDIAAGLGDKVVVLGISAGGTVAAWAAQNRHEVDRAIIVAPFLGLTDLGMATNLALMRVMLFLPDVSMWKDPILRARWNGMPHAYARQSTRGTGEVMRLGYALLRQIAAEVPAGGAAIFVTNAADRAVDNSMTDTLAAGWAQWGAPVARTIFPAEDGLGHEIIDPMEPGAEPALTYPLLLEMIDAPMAELVAASAAWPATTGVE